MSEETLIRTVQLPVVIDLGATVLFSMTGAMEAIRRHYDPIGLFVLALACGLGGGLRDITNHRAVIMCLEDQMNVK